MTKFKAQDKALPCRQTGKIKISEQKNFVI